MSTYRDEIIILKNFTQPTNRRLAYVILFSFIDIFFLSILDVL